MKILFSRYDCCIFRDSPETINEYETKLFRNDWVDRFGWFSFIFRRIYEKQVEFGFELFGVQYTIIVDQRI